MSASKVLKMMKDKQIEFVDLRFTDPRGTALNYGCIGSRWGHVNRWCIF